MESLNGESDNVIVIRPYHRSPKLGWSPNSTWEVRGRSPGWSFKQKRLTSISPDHNRSSRRRSSSWSLGENASSEHKRTRLRFSSHFRSPPPLNEGQGCRHHYSVFTSMSEEEEEEEEEEENDDDDFNMLEHPCYHDFIMQSSLPRGSELEAMEEAAYPNHHLCNPTTTTTFSSYLFISCNYTAKYCLHHVDFKTSGKIKSNFSDELPVLCSLSDYYDPSHSSAFCAVSGSKLYGLAGLNLNPDTSRSIVFDLDTLAPLNVHSVKDEFPEAICARFNPPSSLLIFAFGSIFLLVFSFG